jgi:hypothetical protein
MMMKGILHQAVCDSLVSPYMDRLVYLSDGGRPRRFQCPIRIDDERTMLRLLAKSIVHVRARRVPKASWLTFSGTIREVCPLFTTLKEAVLVT